MKWNGWAAKLATAIPLVLVAAFLAWYGGFIIANVFAEYKDSSDAAYLTIGGASLAVSALFATAALLTVSPSRSRWGWLVLAVLALLASALPFASMVGSVGYAANAALALLAVGSALAYLVGSRRGRAGRHA
jgi:dolichol kinase